MASKSDKPAWQLYPWQGSKERILVGATVAFSRKGFYGASVREISFQAGLEQPSIYHHFGSKENLYWVSLRATHLFMIRQMRRRILRTGGLTAEIRSMLAAITWFHEQYPEFFEFLFSLVYSSPPEIGARYTSEYGGDIVRFVDLAFKRNPPRSGKFEKYSLTVHTLYSYILAHSGRRPQKLRVSYYAALRRILQED